MAANSDAEDAHAAEDAPRAHFWTNTTTAETREDIPGQRMRWERRPKTPQQMEQQRARDRERRARLKAEREARAALPIMNDDDDDD
jgi:hypothetical protein